MVTTNSEDYSPDKSPRRIEEEEKWRNVAWNIETATIIVLPAVFSLLVVIFFGVAFSHEPQVPLLDGHELIKLRSQVHL